MPLFLPNMAKHFNITIHGKVQGVFFRQSTKQMADLLGIKGFVRNEPNNTVYCEAESENEEMLHRFADWCHHGPAAAQVALVSITDSALKGFSDFVIDRSSRGEHCF